MSSTTTSTQPTLAKQLFTMIQGAIAMSTITRDRKYLINTLTYLEHLVKKEIKK